MFFFVCFLRINSNIDGKVHFCCLLQSGWRLSCKPLRRRRAWPQPAGGGASACRHKRGGKSCECLIVISFPKHSLSSGQLTDLLCDDLTASVCGYASCSMVSPGLLAPETPANTEKQQRVTDGGHEKCVSNFSGFLPNLFLSLLCCRCLSRRGC